nr:sodium- and chloride-dependent glycine transporter 1-like isoform X2 [Onthophagus taurus]XP_022916045.1 sodium- and chloride-dependent glycine transporter 1-like isoform X2 [Onthophagus taurus]
MSASIHKMNSSMANVRNLFKRSVEFQIIRDKRIKQIKRIAGAEPEIEDEDEFELSNTQFVTACLIYQTNIYHIFNFIDILAKNRGFIVFVGFFVVEMFVTLPLMSLFIFMSSYSKKGFITFWDCVPVFAGIGYSLLLCRITYGIFQVQFMTAPLILFIKSLFTDDVIEDVSNNCKQDTNGVCYPMHPKNPLNVSCPTNFLSRGKNETIYMATQHYYRFYIMGYDRFVNTILKVNNEFVFASLFIWIVVFAISIFGVRRIAKITLNLQILLSFFVCSIAIYGLILTNDPIVSRPPEGSLAQIDFWVEMLIHSADIIVVSDSIYIGTLKPKSLSPIKAGIQVVVFKYIFFMAMMVYTQRCSQLVLGHYKFTDARCLLIFGHDVLFAFIPDVLYRVRFGVGLSIFWYLVLFWSNLNMLIFTTIGCASALLEKFQRLRRFKILVYFGFCAIEFIASIYFCTNLSINTIYTYRFNGDIYYSTVCFVFISFALMFIYSTKRIIEDYTFTYGNPPPKFWIVSWQTAPIVALFAFIYMFYEMAQSKKIFLIFSAIIWSYIHCIIMISPVFMQFLSKCCRHVKLRRMNTVTKPSDSWGPYDTEQNRARKFYFPGRDARYRTERLTCQHTCIANSKTYAEEKLKHRMKWHKLLGDIQKSHGLPKGRLVLIEDPN